MPHPHVSSGHVECAHEWHGAGDEHCFTCCDGCQEDCARAQTTPMCDFCYMVEEFGNWNPTTGNHIDCEIEHDATSGYDECDGCWNLMPVTRCTDHSNYGTCYGDYCPNCRCTEEYFLDG